MSLFRSRVVVLKRFPRAVVKAIDEASIIGVQAGANSDHRFIGVWPVVVDGRVYARSWTMEAEGWNRAFQEDPRGVIQVGDRQLRVRGIRARGERVRDKVEAAYAAKYDTKASQKYVRGFKTARRRDTTIEFVPR